MKVIDAEKIIEWINSQIKRIEGYDKYPQFYMGAIKSLEEVKIEINSGSLDAPAAAEGWQPIKTAPKGKKDFIARCRRDRSGEIVHIVGHFEEDGFYMEDRTELSFNYTPIEWMPLPPPTTRAPAGGDKEKT